jgi:two-component system sensor histidine kinase BaeS
MKFDRIWIKVFLISAVMNVSLALGAYLFSMWSFDLSLNRYIEDHRQQRLMHLADRLAEHYEKRNGWQEIVGNPLIVEKLILNTMLDDLPPLGQGRHPEAPHSQQRWNGGLPMGFFLLGSDGRRLLGRDILLPDGSLIPIRAPNGTVGYLGAPPGLSLSPAILLAFAEQQRHGFFLIALGMLGASVIGAFGIARWFGRSIGEIARGTRDLIRGDCSTRIPCSSQDELGQLAQDFNTLAGTLASNRESRRDWIVDIAHELRTPLTVILGEIEAIEDGIHQNDDDWLRRIGQRTRQLSLLVNDLYQLGLSDRGMLVYNNDRLDLGELVSDFLDTHHITFDHAGLQVIRQIGMQTLVLGDVDRLRQLLCNLLQNSLRYTDMPGTLRVNVWRDKSKVFLIWEDSAPGVPKDVLGRLTDRLYREDDSRNRSRDGLGLGLSIAKAITDSHGGAMRGSISDLGGLCWTLELPFFAQELEHA